jgi:hypothetical protein
MPFDAGTLGFLVVGFLIAALFLENLSSGSPEARRQAGACDDGVSKEWTPAAVTARSHSSVSTTIR